MTREEAIMWIKTLQEDAIFEVNEALLLAIEALSADAENHKADDTENPKRDLISRADAIEAVANAIWHYPNECYHNLNDFEMAETLAKDALSALPSADRPAHFVKCKILLSREDFEKMRTEMVRQNENIVLLPPGLEVADRPGGEWKPIELNGYPYVTCDQCGLLADMVQSDNGTLVMSMANADETYANYCPNCGAKMKGGEDE